MSTPAHDWIEHLEHPFQPWAQRIHVHLLAQNGVSCRMRYGVPFYDRRSWVCYLHRIKKTAFRS